MSNRGVIGLKIYVSIDIEGLPGVVSTTMVAPGRSQFNRGSIIMTRIAKSLAEYLFENGFERVVIADSHGLMTNIDYLEMPRGVTLIQGYPRPYSMVLGVDDSFDAVMFIGYHAGAGTMHGFLDHTYSGRVFHEIIVNGIRASEYLINALVVGEKNVPVILVAGDEHLREQVVNHTPWAVFIDLKKGISRYAAEYDSFEEVLDKLRKGVQIAVNRLKRGEARPLQLDKPYNVVVRVHDPLIADVLEMVEGLKRIDAYSYEFKADTALKLLGKIEEIALIGYGVEALKNAIR